LKYSRWYVNFIKKSLPLNIDLYIAAHGGHYEQYYKFIKWINKSFIYIILMTCVFFIIYYLLPIGLALVINVWMCDKHAILKHYIRYLSKYVHSNDILILCANHNY